LDFIAVFLNSSWNQDNRSLDSTGPELLFMKSLKLLHSSLHSECGKVNTVMQSETLQLEGPLKEFLNQPINGFFRRNIRTVKVK
jgi:hypothetical protein